MDLLRVCSFFVCLVALMHAATHVFFVSGLPWPHRLLLVAARLGLAACACLFSAQLFAQPSEKLRRTLPMQLFAWSAGIILVLFAASWYFGDLAQQCAPFISSRTLQRF
jgi:hypothetical protein